jgi:integrase
MASNMIKTKYTGVYHRDTVEGDRIFYIVFKKNGKTIYEKIGSKVEGITAAYCSKMRAKQTSIERLKDDAPLNIKEIPTFDEVANEYFKYKSDKPDTKNNIGRYENHLKTALGKLRLYEIDSNIVNSLIKKKKTQISSKTNKTYSPKTINDMINLTGTIFNYAIKQKDIKVINPVANSKVEKLKVDNDRERYLDTDEIKKLIDYLNNRKGKDYVNEYIMLFVKIALSTGARLTSVLTVTKADINLKQETIIIKNHKSNRTYTSHIHPTLKPLLEKKMKDLSPIDYIISGNPTVMHRTSINKVLQPIFNELFNQGLPTDDYKRRVVIHTLRHTFASLLAISGTPIYTIKKLMDHSDINQTMRYAKLQPEAGASAVKGLEI